MLAKCIPQRLRVRRAWADNVDTDPCALEIADPTPDEIAHRRLGGPIDAHRRAGIDRGRRADDDNGRTRFHQRQGALHGGDDAFDVRVELLVIGRLGDLPQRGMDIAAGIGDESIDPLELRPDLGKQPIQSRRSGNIGNDANRVAAKFRDGAMHRIPATSCDDDPHALRRHLPRDGKPIPLLPPVTTATLLLAHVLTVLFLYSSLQSPRLPAVFAEEVDCWAVRPIKASALRGGDMEADITEEAGWTQRDA